MRQDAEHVLRRRPVLRGEEIRGDLADERRGGEVVELGEIRAAVGGLDELRGLGGGDVVPEVAAAELLDVEPRLEARHEHVERARQKLLAQRRIVLSLQGGGEHVVRPDGHAVGWVCRAMDGRRGEVHLAVRRARGLSHEAEHAVGVRAGDNAAEDLLHVIAVLRREADAVVARGERGEDELVGVALRGVAQSGVGAGVFVKLQLVEVDERRVERVEELRLKGEGLKVNVSAPDLALHAVAERRVDQPQLARRVILGREAEPLEVVDEPVKALHALLERAGNGLALRAAAPVPEGERKLQRLRPGSFDRFSRGEHAGLGEPADAGLRMVKAADGERAEKLPGHELERRAAQGRAVQPLALGEREKAGHDLHAELRQRRAEDPAAAVEIVEKAAAGQPRQIADALVRGGLLGVGEHLRHVRRARRAGVAVKYGVQIGHALSSFPGKAKEPEPSPCRVDREKARALRLWRLFGVGFGGVVAADALGDGVQAGDDRALLVRRVAGAALTEAAQCFRRKAERIAVREDLAAQVGDYGEVRIERRRRHARRCGRAPRLFRALEVTLQLRKGFDLRLECRLINAE